MQRGRENFVSAVPSAELVQRLAGLGHGICSDFGSEACRDESAVGGDGEVFDLSDEIFAPLLDCAGFAVNPVKMRLDVAVRAGNVSDFDAEKDMAVVVGPLQLLFCG